MTDETPKPSPLSGILTNKAFWAAVITIIVLIVQQFNPGFNPDSEALQGFLVIVFSYILGVSIDQGAPGWRGALKSRKFWAALVSGTLMILSASGVKLPMIPEEAYIEIAYLIGTLIAGMALEANFPAFKFR